MTLSISDGIVWQDVPGDLALFDTRSERYFGLNGSAAAIWREIAQGTAEGALPDTLGARLGILPDEIEADVANFVRDALAQGLLRRTRV